MTATVKAADLPVGTRVTTAAGTVYIRDRRGEQGWWMYPVGFYMDGEIDALIGEGATVAPPQPDAPRDAVDDGEFAGFNQVLRSAREGR